MRYLKSGKNGVIAATSKDIADISNSCVRIMKITLSHTHVISRPYTTKKVNMNANTMDCLKASWNTTSNGKNGIGMDTWLISPRPAMIDCDELVMLLANHKKGIFPQTRNIMKSDVPLDRKTAKTK